MKLAGILCWIQLQVLICSARIMFPKVPAIFFFGASILDVGTNNYIPNCTIRADFLPYGETFFHHPTGRFSNGLILPDFLEMTLGLPFVPPYMQPKADFTYGANFASAGSTLVDHKLNIIKFEGQLAQFEHLLQSKSTNYKLEKLSKSLIVVNSGTNDLLYTGTPPSKLIEHFTKGLMRLYKAGARNFLIVGVGAESRAPRVKMNYIGSLELLDKSIREYNHGLKNITKQFRREIPDINILYFDSYALFMDMIDNGDKYGFVNTYECCCGAGLLNGVVGCGIPGYLVCQDPSKYLFWDSHPTQRGYYHMANAIWSGDSSLMWPINLQTLIENKFSM